MFQQLFEVFSHLGMPKQKPGPKHDAPLKCDLIKKIPFFDLRNRQGLQNGSPFCLQFQSFLCLCRRNLLAWRNERELQTLSTMLSLNDPLLSTVPIPIQE